MIAGWEFSVLFSSQFGPFAIVRDRLNPKVSSISSKNGLAVPGKLSTQELAIPTRCTPWPGPISVSGIRISGVDGMTNRERIELCAILLWWSADRYFGDGGSALRLSDHRHSGWQWCISDWGIATWFSDYKRIIIIQARNKHIGYNNMWALWTVSIRGVLWHRSVQ